MGQSLQLLLPPTAWNLASLLKLVEAIASGVTSPLPLDELAPDFINIASRNANELLPEILNKGIKDAGVLIA
jgi:hypothetical protein